MNAHIPWERIADFTGRATDLGRLIARVNADPRDIASLAEIQRRIVHQDGVIQATPLALMALRARSGESFCAFLESLRSAAAYQVGDAVRPRDIPRLEGLVSEENLLPPFISAEEDEAMFEEWSPPDEAWQAWTRLTLDIVTQRQAAAKLAGLYETGTTFPDATAAQRRRI